MHVGIVVNEKPSRGARYLIVHNIGAGPRMEDVLFRWKITGHYRYFGPGWYPGERPGWKNLLDRSTVKVVVGIAWVDGQLGTKFGEEHGAALEG
jgi:hypothetical protein